VTGSSRDQSAVAVDPVPQVVRGNGSIVSRMWEPIDRACYCPIVYNSLEAFKDEMGRDLPWLSAASKARPLVIRMPRFAKWSRLTPFKLTFMIVPIMALRSAAAHGCLTVLGARRTRERIRGASPGTVTGFPANSARNPVAVPGLRRISGQLSPKTVKHPGRTWGRTASRQVRSISAYS
jgi:hypothetical protein